VRKREDGVKCGKKNKLLQESKIKGGIVMLFMQLVSLPLRRPHIERLMTAQARLLLSPKKMHAMDEPHRPKSRMGLLPYRSDIYPQKMDVQNCAKKNDDANFTQHGSDN
jgi:hypothetical protein